MEVHLTGGLEPAPSWGGRVWRGKVDGDKYSEAVFAGTPGIVVGRISTSTGTYRLRTDGAGRRIFESFRPSAVPDGLPAILVPEAAIRTSQAESCVPSPPHAIRVIPAVTERAKEELGERDYLSWLQIVASDTNLAMLQSGTSAGIELLPPVVTTFVGSPGSGKESPEDDLATIRFNKEASAIDLRESRRTQNGDILVVIMAYKKVGGLAAQFSLGAKLEPGAFAPYAVAVVAADAMTAGYSFTHELGHIFGADHDRKYAGGTGDERTFGHIEPKARPAWKTLMGQKNDCEGCVTRMFWSNPEPDGLGHHFGNEHPENNARTIDIVAPTIGKLHCYLDKGAPPAR